MLLSNLHVYSNLFPKKNSLNEVALHNYVTDLLFKSLISRCRLALVKNSICLFDLLLYGPDNSYGNVRMLAIERDIKH